MHAAENRILSRAPAIKFRPAAARGSVSMAVISRRIMGRPAHTQTAPPRAASFTVFGHKVEAPPLAPGLHVVATPIGNLGDMSLRALATLAAADAILAEDKRVTRPMLSHYGIATPLVAYHEHNAAEARPRIIERLVQGACLALVSDAGTPLVSDPGYKLVVDAVAAGVAVHGVPGASAVMAALVVAGLPTDRFFFEGFLPPKSAARRQRVAALAAIPGTLVFFESPRRVAETLEDLAAVLGPRDAAMARELTKHFETVRRGTRVSLAAELAAEVIGGEPVAVPSQSSFAAARPRAAASLPLHSARRHSFVVVDPPNTAAGFSFSDCIFVEPALRAHFQIGRSSAALDAALDSLPPVFAGTASRLEELVALLSSLVAAAFRAQELELPPWRRQRMLLER